MSAFDIRVSSANTQLSLLESKAVLQSIAQSPGISKSPAQLIALDDASDLEGSDFGLVSKFVNAAVADNTRRAYRQDLTDFLRWGGSIPCPCAMVAAYIADRAQNHAAATLTRRIVGIGRAHASQGLDDPTKSDLVRTVLRGIRRINGSAQRQVKPLLKNDLIAMLAYMSGTKGARDRALLLVGFAAALRRSELAALRVEDVEFVREGAVVLLRKSKTDQMGEGRKIGIPWGRQGVCPVKSLERWLACAGIDAGPIFRPVNGSGLVGQSQLSAQSIALIIKDYASQIGLDASQFSGHSLRAGLVTSAIQAGVGLYKVQQQTGHKSAEMLARYVRDAGLFDGNAAGAVL